MYAVMRRYQYDPQAAAELNRQVREGFVPLLQQTPGFVAYYWLDSGTGTGASMSVFADQAGAEASVRLAADFVRQHLAALTLGEAEVIQGEVQAHA